MVIVVRLSDVVSWNLSSSCETTQDWCFAAVYALTCQDIFLHGGIGPEMNIARVSLNALGAEIPPD